MISQALSCDRCGWRTVSGADDVARRLRAAGFFRRAPHPPEELILEVLAAHGDALNCDRCGAADLRICDGRAEQQADEWEVVRLCELCREPIPPERLEALPHATRCTQCQDAADRGRSMVEPDYCPKCGALVEIRVSRGRGPTRYKQFCTGQPPCRLD